MPRAACLIDGPARGFVRITPEIAGSNPGLPASSHTDFTVFNGLSRVGQKCRQTGRFFEAPLRRAELRDDFSAKRR